MIENPMNLSVTVDIALGAPLSAGALNRILRAEGFQLHYDVYAVPRAGDAPAWHSDNLAIVTLLREGRESDAQDGADAIRLMYPLPWLFADHIEHFADLVERVSAALKARPSLGELAYTRERFLAACDEQVTCLLTEWGEEPGSAALFEIGEGIREQEFKRHTMWAAHGKAPPKRDGK